MTHPKNQSIVTEWINNRFGVNLNDQDLSSIKDFSLIWNVFEDTVCSNNFSIATAETQILTRQLNLQEFQNTLDYFKNRYVENGSTNQRFGFLHFRPNDREDFVRQVLLGNITDTHQIVLAITIIVYRFRNNLFHGMKDIRVIDQQRDNFQHANSFLTTLLNHF